MNTCIEIHNCKDIATLFSIKNECVRYKHNIKTKEQLVSLFHLHNINCSLIQKESVNIDIIINQIDVQLMKYCNHCWRQEWIDTSIHEAKLVTYCEYCEVTRN